MFLANYRQLLLVVFYLFFMIFSSMASAHQLSTGYLNLEVDNVQPRNLNGQIQLRWFDLDRKVNLDINHDGQLKWNEVTAKQIPLSEFVLTNLALSAGYGADQSQFCNLNLANNMRTDTHFDEGYLVYDFSVICPESVVDSSLIVKYTGIFDIDTDHKLVISVKGLKDASSNISGLIDHTNQSTEFSSEQSGILTTFSTFVYQGIVHILIGTDHILFIIVLLLTCALYRENREWRAKSSFVDIAKSAAWIVTAFTLAHSITLTAAALGWVVPSSRWVEFGIALSVLFTALNNIWPIIARLGWITFAFGLLHGMGFASVLAELGLAKEHKLLSIVSFNLGVELGQLAILALVIPLLFLVRKQSWYQHYGVNFGSFAIAAVAVSWCVERF